MKNRKNKLTAILSATLFLTAAIICFAPVAAQAQGTGFNFQGRLNDGSNPANGSYDLQFRLYDAIVGGNQIGAVVSRPATTLINGVFSTTLDFGAAAFNNPNSVFIEIAVKPNGSPNAYTILGPRQQLTVVPFAIRSSTAANADNAANAVNAQNSVNATNATNATTATNSLSLGGVAASQYVTQTNGGNTFIRNSTTAQPNANLNISGTGVFGGNVGIGGTTSASSKLLITGQDGLAISGFQPFLTLEDSSFSGVARSEIQSAEGELALFSNVTNNPAPLAVRINNGNIRQPANANGLVKAMIFVNANGTISRCYNGITNSSIGNCGFAISHPSLSGVYFIDFGFRTDNRFVSVTPQSDNLINFIAGFFFFNTNTVRVITERTDQNDEADDAFIIIIY